MKLALLIPFIACLCTACVTTETNPSHSAQRAEAPEPTAGDPQIHTGMTKAQVIRLWGEPSGRQVSGSGEIWTWGGQRWKRIIPYAGPFLNVQTSKVIFGINGRVRDFRLTDHGDTMTDMEGMMPGHLPW